MNFSDNLIKLRKGKSWSQEDLAEKLGISRQAVSKWEVGTSKPDIDNVIKISKLFEVSIDELVNNEIIKTEAISINVKRKSKKDVLLVWLRRLLIVLIIIYFINVIYKFAMLFTITQAELKYKELDNYHYVVTKYDDTGLIEKEECWYKDGVFKMINIIYKTEGQTQTITCIDYNINKGYLENNNNKILIDVEEYKKINPSGKNQLYSKLPLQLRNETSIKILISVCRYYGIDITIKDNNVFLYLENSMINLERGTMKPVSFYYKDNNLEKFITSYFIIELNCVDELKI